MSRAPVLFALLCLTFATVVISQQFTQAEIDQTLYYHNLYRTNVRPVASSMPALTWDTKLATVAFNWAAKCTSSSGSLVDHNPNRSTDYGTGYVGENIYASTSSSATPYNAITSWNNENTSYAFSSNTCASGQVCGHYTQIIWAKTTAVGCAKSTCNSLTYKYNIVCNYFTGGNVQGQTPYTALSTIPPSTASCANGLTVVLLLALIVPLCF